MAEQSDLRDRGAFSRRMAARLRSLFSSGTSDLVGNLVLVWVLRYTFLTCPQPLTGFFQGPPGQWGGGGRTRKCLEDREEEACGVEGKCWLKSVVRRVLILCKVSCFVDVSPGLSTPRSQHRPAESRAEEQIGLRPIPTGLGPITSDLVFQSVSAWVGEGAE